MMRTQTHAGANEPVAGADGAGVVPCVPAPIPRGACRRNALANLFEPQQTAAATTHSEHAQQEEDEEGAMSAGDARAGKGWGKLKTRIAAGRAASFIGEAHLGNIADDAASSDGEGGRPRKARTSLIASALESAQLATSIDLHQASKQPFSHSATQPLSHSTTSMTTASHVLAATTLKCASASAAVCVYEPNAIK